ncbi:MAG: DUF389 domain-containing protein [Ilumatobacteraceae bacterium]|nr:DUF389 domain-containing protein [Ilumatobacteraceae bacterium]
MTGERAADGGREPRSFQRLRDLTGEVRRPRVEYDHLLLDDGHLDREEQQRIFSLLLPNQNRRSVVRFLLMLTLSVTIAVMGLAANSAAVVIGAMLIAPMMTPIMTFASSVGLGLGKRAAQAAFLVTIGAVWSVLFSVFLARVLPTVLIDSEVLARTRPDVRDLIVAVAAGAAGAYATAREDMSGALPGVAVAVALVPPLAATGILIDAQERVLAEGSALLFVTNLFAITFSALVVFLATGVIPTIRLCFQSSRIAMTTIGIVLATALIAVPLTTRSLDAATSSRQRTAISVTVDEWIGDLQLDVVGLDVLGPELRLELTGPDEPPEAHLLATRLVPELGDDAEVVVRWDQRSQGVARADAPPAVEPADVVRDVIDGWVVGLADDGVLLRVVELVYDDGLVDVTVSGPAAPPPAPGLSAEVADAVGRTVDLKLQWIQSFDPGLGGEPPGVRVDRLVRAWIGPRSSVRYIASDVSGGTTTIDLGSDGTPRGLETLRRIVLDAIDGSTRVEVRLLPVTVIEIAPDVVAIPDLN